MTSVALLATASAAVTAVLGIVVAGLAYRGYRRNDSPIMRALAGGIVAIAVGPFVVDVLGTALPLTDAQSLLAVTLSHALGLFIIYRTFDSDI